MALILAAPAYASFPSADEVIHFDTTLAVADASEVLFTVPAGKRLRSLSVANMGPSPVHINTTAGATATTGDLELEKRDSFGETNLDLPEGTYAFVGSSGATPRVRGIACVGPA